MQLEGWTLTRMSEQLLQNIVTEKQLSGTSLTEQLYFNLGIMIRATNK
jgi:hypothetical protein